MFKKTESQGKCKKLCKEKYIYKRRLGILFLLIGITVILTACRENETQNQKSTQKIESEEDQIKQTQIQESDSKVEHVKETEQVVFDSEQIKGIRVERDGETLLDIQYQPVFYKAYYDYWNMIVPYESTVSVNTEEMYNYYENIVTLFRTWRSVLDDAKNTETQVDKEIDTKSLETPDARISVIFSNDSEEEQSAEIKYEETLCFQAVGDKYQVWPENRQEQVIEIEKENVENCLSQEPFQLILKVPVIVDMTTVSEVEVTSSGKAHILKKAGESWKLDGKKLGQEEFSDIYSMILDIPLIEEAEKIKVKNEPFLQICFHRTSSEAPEIRVNYYEDSGGKMLVEINQKTFFYVSADQVKKLKKTIFL